ncbi:hypothetical protein MMC28_004165 [Mycoblastus sanguinarius]|nr:hypothetical protein [Mycoblastus sanguinarius]
MSESVSPPEELRSDHKSFGKRKWRGKLFSSDGKFGKGGENIESNDDDIANFLHAAVIRPEAKGQNSLQAPQVNAAAAPRWPSTTQDPQSNTIVDVYRRPKPRQNKGLKVSFQSTAPEIIGEGGDEAELPAKDVLLSIPAVTQPELSPFLKSARTDKDDRELSAEKLLPDFDSDAHFRPPPVHRRPTGFQDFFVEQQSPDKKASPKDPMTDVSSSRNNEQLPYPTHHLQEQNFKYVKPDDKYIFPYGSSLNTGDVDSKDMFQHISPLGNEKVGTFASQSLMNGIEGIIDREREISLDIPSPEFLLGNSLTPGASPQALPLSKNVSSSSYGFPNTKPAAQTHAKLQPSQTTRAKAELDKEQPLPTTEPKAFSLRNVAKSLGTDALDEFDGRVRRFNDVFQMGVSAQGGLAGISLAQWVRTSTWWFLKGRSQLESTVRSKSRTTEGSDSGRDAHSSRTLKQAYINLAKSWWIAKDITPNHPQVTKFGKMGMTSLVVMAESLGDRELAELLDAHSSIVANIRALTMSMKRNERLPPADLEIQRLEVRVLLDFPALPTKTAQLLISNCSRAKDEPHEAERFFPVLLSDTARHFSFSRMFVDVALTTHIETKQELIIPCVVSVIRQRNEWNVQATIASEDGQIDLVVGSESHAGATWKDVHWKISSQAMDFRLSDVIDIRVQFSEKDFKTLWGICDYTQRIRKDFTPRKGEELVFERDLKSFQCSNSSSFPSDRIKDCKLRLFEKRNLISKGTGQRKIHDGHRLMVITPPAIKTLSSVNQSFGKAMPILFSSHKDTDGPILNLREPGSAGLSFSFHENEDLDLLQCLICGKWNSKEHYRSTFLALQRFAIRDSSIVPDKTSPDVVSNLRWYKLGVIEKGRPPYGHDLLPTMQSEHLRIFAECDIGTFVDRINLGPGELQMNLSVDDINVIKLLRAPQQDMTWSFADGKLSSEKVDSLCQELEPMATSASIRMYTLNSLPDLHSFQGLVTGVSVLYDGIAISFAIARRRTVVPIYKRLEARTARLQVIQQDKVVQLLAYFKDFSLGACMSFALKVTDTFETANKSGTSYLRIVDAKFALPKTESDPSREFVCLDTPEYPGEHDDITIGFGDGQGMYTFSSD